MGVRTKRWPTALNEGAPEFLDTDQGQREGIDSEGYIYHMGQNESRNFLDDGRGLAVPSSGTSLNIVQDAIPFGDARS